MPSVPSWARCWLIRRSHVGMTKNLPFHSSHQKSGHLSLQHVRPAVVRSPIRPLFPCRIMMLPSSKYDDATVDTQYTHRAEYKTDSSEIHGNAIRANKKRREWKLNTEKFVALPLFFRNDALSEFFLPHLGMQATYISRLKLPTVP